MASHEGNNTISKNRGKAWKANVMKGRRDALLNPSKMRLLRLQRGLLQDAVAKAIGVSESTYQAIERGKRVVDSERAQQIAAYFKVETNSVFERVNPKRKYRARLATFE